MRSQSNVLRDQEVSIKYQALNSLFYFEKNILGYKDLTSENKEWCWDLEQRHKRVLMEAPRKTYKTTVHTKGYPIWELEHNQNLRILLVNEIESNAIKFLREIKGHYERNHRFRHFFGDRIGRKWDEKEIIIRGRTENHSEASITAIGFGSSLISAHYDIIICDDLVGMKDRESQVIREKKIEFYHDLRSLLMPEGILILLGTRWHYADLYDYIENEVNPMKEEKEKFQISVQGCYTKDNESSFPNHFSTEVLKDIEIEVGQVLFSANYRNSPLTEGSKIFRLEDLEYFNYLDFMNEVDKLDRKEKRKKKEEREKVVKYWGYLDPSLGKLGSDYVAFIIGGVLKDGYIRIVEWKVDLLTPKQQVELMIEYEKKYRFEKFGIEGNGFQELLENEVEEKSAEEKVYIPIDLINHSTNKQIRIENAEPMIKRYVRFRGDWRQVYPRGIKQLTQFPAGANDDAPDSLEGLISMIKGSTLQFY